jgi:hypothetical protein
MGRGLTPHGVTEKRAELRRSSIDIATQSVENPVIVNIGVCPIRNPIEIEVYSAGCLCHDDARQYMKSDHCGEW